MRMICNFQGNLPDHLWSDIRSVDLIASVCEMKGIDSCACIQFKYLCTRLDEGLNMLIDLFAPSLHTGLLRSSVSKCMDCFPNALAAGDNSAMDNGSFANCMTR